jgi:hypothetical protein
VATIIIKEQPGGTCCPECDINVEIDDRGEYLMLILAWSFFVWNSGKGEVTMQEQTIKKDTEKESSYIKGYKKFGKANQIRQDYLMRYHFNTPELSPA